MFFCKVSRLVETVKNWRVIDKKTLRLKTIKCLSLLALSLKLNQFPACFDTEPHFFKWNRLVIWFYSKFILCKGFYYWVWCAIFFFWGWLTLPAKTSNIIFDKIFKIYIRLHIHKICYNFKVVFQRKERLSTTGAKWRIQEKTNNFH